MNEIIDKLGELLVSYDDILDEFNTNKLCGFFLEKKYKIIDLCEIMTKKYKDTMSSELLNYFILKLFTIYDKSSGIKNPDKCFNELEKIIDEYQDSLSNKNLKIFMNIIINLHRI